MKLIQVIIKLAAILFTHGNIKVFVGENGNMSPINKPHFDIYHLDTDNPEGLQTYGKVCLYLGNW